MERTPIDLKNLHSLEEYLESWKKTFSEDRRDPKPILFEKGRTAPQINRVLDTIFGMEIYNSINIYNVIDYGCGNGPLILPLLKRHPEIKKYVCVNQLIEKDNLNEQLRKSVSESDTGQTEFIYMETEEFEKCSPIFSPDENAMIFMIDVLHEIPLIELPRRILSLYKNLNLDSSLLIAEFGEAICEPEAVWWEEDDIACLFPDTIFDVKYPKTPMKIGSGFPFRLVSVTRNNPGNPDVRDIACICEDIYRSKSLRCLKRIEENGKAIKSVAAKIEDINTEKNLANKRMDLNCVRECESKVEELDKEIDNYEIELCDLQILHTSIKAQLREYQSTLPKIPVGDHGYSICFHQANIGNELETLNELKTQAGRKVLFSFGQYDIISINRFEELDSFEDALLPHETVQNVINTNTVICFD